MGSNKVKLINPTIFPEGTIEERKVAIAFFEKLRFDRCPICSHYRVGLRNDVEVLLRKKWSPRAISEFLIDGVAGSNYPVSNYEHQPDGCNKYIVPTQWRGNIYRYLEYGILYHIAFCRGESYEKYAIKHVQGYQNIKTKIFDLIREREQIESSSISKTGATKAEIKKGAAISIPDIISTQLLIIQKQQQEYLNGERRNPPNIGELTKILTQLEKLIGSHELSDIVDD